MTIEKDEAIEIKPFSLDYDQRAGLLDLRPKAVDPDPKVLHVDAPSVEPPPMPEPEAIIQEESVEAEAEIEIPKVEIPKVVSIPAAKGLNTIKSVHLPMTDS